MMSILLPLILLGAAGEIDYETLSVTSSLDGTEQPSRYYAAPEDGPQGLLVLLHSWSTDVHNYDPDTWVVAARNHGWHVVVPHFRGGNFNPEACASPAARQDILDAAAAVTARFAVDRSRIYLAGSSGGGHMSMVMAGYNPETWTAVSAWVGISELADWHAETQAAGTKYYKDVEACVGGIPGSSPDVDREIRARSPLYHIANATELPLDLNAGIHDGHTGSVPIHHSIDAYNMIAEATGGPTVSQSTINALSQEIVAPTPPVEDPAYERPIHLRAEAGKARLTIFEGGHEGLPESSCAWLARHKKP